MCQWYASRDAVLAAHALIAEGGAVLACRPDEDLRVVLDLEHAEVEWVLAEVVGQSFGAMC